MLRNEKILKPFFDREVLDSEVARTRRTQTESVQDDPSSPEGFEGAGRISG